MDGIVVAYPERMLKRSYKDNPMDRFYCEIHRQVELISHWAFAVPALHFIIAYNTKVATG